MKARWKGLAIGLDPRVRHVVALCSEDMKRCSKE